MADIVSQIASLSVKLTLYRASDDATKTRTFSVRNPAIDEQGTQFRAALQDLQNFLLGDGKTLIQPTGWRDNDVNEEEYVTTAVEFTTENGAETKWDTRLSHNMQLSSSTISAATISTNPDSPTEVTLSGANINFTDLQIRRSVYNSSSDYLYTDLATNGDNFVICLVGNSTSVSGNEYVFSLPESGVYQADSVTLTIGA